MVKMINLTPHNVTLCGENGETISVFPPEAIPARCGTTTEVVGNISVSDGITVPLKRTVFGEVSGLPAADSETIYIVSAIVAQAVKGKRNDCVIPNESIRDSEGRIVGCKSFAAV